jgi:WD40 repeat protein
MVMPDIDEVCPSFGQERTLSGHSTKVNSVAFSPDGTRIASGSGEMNDRHDLGRSERPGGQHTQPWSSLASMKTTRTQY